MQLAQQTVAAGQAAAQAVAHPHGDARGGGVVFQDLEVVVERRHLEHLDHGQTHLGRQRHDVALEQTMEMVVEHMQVLDQQIPTVTV